MPTKKTETGREYEITGKRFVWHPLDDDDETGNLPDITIPLRMKIGLIWQMDDDGATLDLGGMRRILTAIVSESQVETLKEMDVHDFQEMFTTWQTEYNALNGASLGEASGSSG